MKKLLVIAIAAVSLAGCMKAERAESADQAWTSHGYAVGGTVVTKVVEIEGHRYVIMSGLKQGGIIHAESCPCRNADVV